jgi:hypothetical protein
MTEPTSALRAALTAAGLPVTPRRMSDALPMRRRRRRWSRFDDDQILAIRADAARGELLIDLAARYDCNRMTISHIVNEHTHTHLIEMEAAA